MEPMMKLQRNVDAVTSFSRGNPWPKSTECIDSGMTASVDDVIIPPV
jgi:hypothetical protein